MTKPKISNVAKKSQNTSNKLESTNYFKFLDKIDSDDNINDMDENVNDINENVCENNINSNDNDTGFTFVSTRRGRNNNSFKNDIVKVIPPVEKIPDENIHEDDGEWQSVEKKKNRNIKQKSGKSNFSRVISDKDINENIFDYENQKDAFDIMDDGSEYKLENPWYIWTHLSESSNWTQESYKNIFTIDSLKTFWEFFGNIDKLDIIKHQFYIMRNSSGPTWEHPSNRNGGICSIRVIKDRTIEIIEQIAILILNECFSDNPSDINGLSFSVKHNWGVIKIWNRTGSNDTSTQIPSYILKKYSSTPRFSSNQPEY